MGCCSSKDLANAPRGEGQKHRQQDYSVPAPPGRYPPGHTPQQHPGVNPFDAMRYNSSDNLRAPHTAARPPTYAATPSHPKHDAMININQMETKSNSHHTFQKNIPCPFTMGEKVEARWRNGPHMYPGWVVAVRNNGTCAIQYTDGEEESHQPINQIQRRFGVGDRIEARWKGSAEYYRGFISDVKGDGKYSIDFDDGGYESNEDASDIRMASDPSAVSRGTLPPPGTRLMKMNRKRLRNIVGPLA